MKRISVLLAAGFLLNTAWAKDDADDAEVILPADAQKCVLPASPNAIPDDASYDQLVAAKADVGTFQASILEFRDCLKQAEEDPDLTTGNKQAIVSSFNYSVEMEERVAERFNVAVRSYKERKAAADG